MAIAAVCREVCELVCGRSVVCGDRRRPYVVPLYHTNKDRIAYLEFFEYPEKIPLYGIVIESWWVNKDKQ